MAEHGTFTDQELMEHRSAALKHARRYLPEEDAQEIASDVILKYLESGKRPPEGPLSIITKRAVIDALRKRFGRSHEPGHELRSALRFAQSVDEDHISLEIAYKPNDALGFVSMIESMDLPPLHRAILLLSATWGFSNSELAHIFGVSLSYVGQIQRGAFFSTPASPPGYRREIKELKTRIKQLENILEAKGIQHGRPAVDT